MKKTHLLKIGKSINLILTFYNEQETSICISDYPANNMWDMCQALAEELQSKDNLLLNY